MENHGGRLKAVYCLSCRALRIFGGAQLPHMELPWSMFGENFTTEGLEEEDTHIGDRFQVGQVAEMVTTRIPATSWE